MNDGAIKSAQIAIKGKTVALTAEAHVLCHKANVGSVSVPRGTNKSFQKGKKRKNPLKKTHVQERLGPANLDSSESEQANDL